MNEFSLKEIAHCKRIVTRYGIPKKDRYAICSQILYHTDKSYRETGRLEKMKIKRKHKRSVMDSWKR
jgi:hypothetical protein